MAVIGTSIRIVAPDRFRWANFALYLVMGWSGVVLGWPLFAPLPETTLTLMLAGGIVYTLGTVFYVAERLPHHTALWHVFVLVASACFFVAVCLRILDSGVAADIAQDFVTAG